MLKKRASSDLRGTSLQLTKEIQVWLQDFSWMHACTAHAPKVVIMVMRKKRKEVIRRKERFLTKEALNCFTNSPCQYYMKYTKNSMENKHIDGWLRQGLKS